MPHSAMNKLSLFESTEQDQTVSSGALHPAPYPEMEDGDACMCSNGAPYTGLHFGGRREVPHR